MTLNTPNPSKKKDVSGWSRIISILVSSEQTPFMPHEAVICSSSDFFRGILRGGGGGGDWKEASELAITLPDINSDQFQVYMQWLYKDHQELGSPSKQVTKLDHVGLLQCWIMGDKLRDDTFKDHVMETLIDRVNDQKKPMSHHGVRYIYNNTPPQSPLRALAAATWVVAKAKPGDLDEHDIPQQFILDLAKVALLNLGKDCFRVSPKSYYFSKNAKKRSIEDAGLSRQS